MYVKVARVHRLALMIVHRLAAVVLSPPAVVSVAVLCIILVIVVAMYGKVLHVGHQEDQVALVAKDQFQQ